MSTLQPVQLGTAAGQPLLAVGIACGSNGACALMDGGGAKFWGAGYAREYMSSNVEIATPV